MFKVGQTRQMFKGDGGEGGGVHCYFVLVFIRSNKTFRAYNIRVGIYTTHLLELFFYINHSTL